MRFPLLLTLALLTTGAATRGLAQDGPRQLNAPPALPDSVRQPAAAPARAAEPTPAPAPVAEQVPSARPQPSNLPPAQATRFRVGLKSGQEVQAYDVETRQPLLGRNYLLLDGQRRLELTDVRYYEDETGFYVRTNLPGSSRESTLRRDRTGRISLYSITTTQYNNMGGSPFGYGRFGYGGMGYPYGGGYRTVKTEYFSKDNGPVQDLNLRNLSIATADNPGARSLLDQARRSRTAITLSYIGAGGLMAAGLLSSLTGTNTGSAISPLVYAAPALLIVPLVLQGKQQRNIKQAISLYNAQQ
ncbi:hypothetical protein FY528_18830 [Hymenobacter lutimineralis]|uniref:Uncharacterized protein n=1 Tax=Hymenobacter lutimineralis TaxID=2606448 RepID=A0A5D6US47_9BACT|nr:hypothetical protein [Hymenobacter lutimineralis]TYZ06293.1 hypothetical protein FY528_18830 [Hymenobacter lutimineralis]